MADGKQISGSQSARRRRNIQSTVTQRRSLSPSHDRLRHSRNRAFNSPSPPFQQATEMNVDDRENDIRIQKIQFFNDHKYEEWLRDFYHPLRETCMQRGKDMLEGAVYEELDGRFFEKVPCAKCEWKYKCKAPGCLKAFEDLKFIRKHLNTKHPEIVKALTENISEEVYFQHYMNDPNGPYPQQIDYFTRLPRAVVPIPGAGPVGPFVAAPVEATWGMIADKTLEPRTSRDTRSLVRYDDLQPPTENEVTVTDYRDIDY